ncbi:MAG: uncharacterized protein H6R26_1767 [Proteobacteria bacterium]|nr:uncharacterized protein [Pseudomonadota bacterium]
MTERQRPRSFQDQGEQHVREEALRMAKATQTPGQTKEQTKLIARGIEKGIALYKQQQKEKTRERDKARKKVQRLAQTKRADVPAEEPDEPIGGVEADSTRLALIVSGSLFLLGSVAHVLRWIMGWEVTVAGHAFPLTASLPIALLAVGLALWLFWAAFKRG